LASVGANNQLLNLDGSLCPATNEVKIDRGKFQIAALARSAPGIDLSELRTM
jgi:hypothetical protein